MPQGILAGATIGLIVGILMEQVSLSLAIGTAVGAVAGSTLTALGATKPERRHAVVARAAAILAAGVAISVLVIVRL